MAHSTNTARQARALLDRELGLLWGLTRRERTKDGPNTRPASIGKKVSRSERAR